MLEYILFLIYQVLAYLESHNKFYEDISIARITAYHSLPRLKSRRPFWMRPIFWGFWAIQKELD